MAQLLLRLCNGDAVQTLSVISDYFVKKRFQHTYHDHDDLWRKVRQRLKQKSALTGMDPSYLKATVSSRQAKFGSLPKLDPLDRSGAEGLYGEASGDIKNDVGSVLMGVASEPNIRTGVSFPSLTPMGSLTNAAAVKLDKTKHRYNQFRYGTNTTENKVHVKPGDWRRDVKIHRWLTDRERKNKARNKSKDSKVNSDLSWLRHSRQRQIKMNKEEKIKEKQTKAAQLIQASFRRYYINKQLRNVDQIIAEARRIPGKYTEEEIKDLKEARAVLMASVSGGRNTNLKSAGKAAVISSKVHRRR